VGGGVDAGAFASRRLHEEAAGHAEAHGEAHGEHGEVVHHGTVIWGIEVPSLHSFLDTQAQLGIVLFLVGATLFFEFLKEDVDERFDTYKAVLAHIWSELTVLGFLALVTFILVQYKLLQRISELVFHEEEHLVHMFEAIHFSLFFVLVMFLFLALWLLLSAAETAEMWRMYREFIRNFEKVETVTEKKKAWLLSVNQDKSYVDFGRNACEVELQRTLKSVELEEEKAAKGCPSCFGPVAKLLAKHYHKSNPFKMTMWDVVAARERARFQRMRHAFLLRPLDPKKEHELPPQDFEFATYLLEAIKAFFEHVMHLGVSAWIQVAFVMFIIFEVAAFFGHVGFYILFICGWLLWVVGNMVQQHFEWVVMELMPIKNLQKAEEELAPLRRTSIFYELYKITGKWLRTLDGRQLPEASKNRPAGLERKKTVQSFSSTGKTSHGEDTQREFLHKGVFDRRGAAPKGENKQTILFLGVSAHGGHGHGAHGAHGGGNEGLQHMAMHPAAFVLQFILLASALYYTIIIVYRKPPSFWDWKVAVTTLPVIMLDIFVAPAMIGPMVISLYTESFVDKKLADGVIQAAKFKKFTNAAKLLHAMQSKVRILKKGKKRRASMDAGKEERAPPTYDQLMSTLEGDKRKKAIDLKESFDKFDDDNSDSLEVKELMPLMNSLGINLDDAQVEQLMAELDFNGDGSVSFGEFADRMLEEDEEEDPKEVAGEIFEMLDKDKSGSLTVDELKEAFEDMHTGLEESEILAIVSKLDDDNTGEIEREEFVTALAVIFAEQ